MCVAVCVRECICVFLCAIARAYVRVQGVNANKESLVRR